MGQRNIATIRATGSGGEEHSTAALRLSEIQECAHENMAVEVRHFLLQLQISLIGNVTGLKSDLKCLLDFPFEYGSVYVLLTLVSTI